MKTTLKVAVAFALATGAFAQQRSPKTPVEFWHTGDDGLSERLADTVERAFKQAPDFTPSFGKQPHALIVTIPENVKWIKKAGRTKVFYTVELTGADGVAISHSSGSCWESDLPKCAAQILDQSRTAVRSLTNQ